MYVCIYYIYIYTHTYNHNTHIHINTYSLLAQDTMGHVHTERLDAQERSLLSADADLDDSLMEVYTYTHTYMNTYIHTQLMNF